MSYSDETLRRPRKVAFYGRVSTELEAQTAALKSQMEWYHKLAAQYPNWSVVNQYADDGVTGTVKEVRRAFMKMLYDAKEGKFDLIVTREVSRFARNTVDTVETVRELRQCGVEVYFVMEDIWTMESDGELRLSILACLAQEESRKISERSRAGQQVKRERGEPSAHNASFGYVYDRQHKTLAIEADKVEAVRKIFEMYADGISCSIIADELNMQGIRNKDGSDSWTTMQVRGIIKNPIYKGYMYRRVVSCTDYLTHKSVSIPEEEREYVKGNFPPIVSEELWEKCRRRRASCGPRKQGPAAQTYWNAGTAPGDKWACRLFCSCGAGMYRQFKTPNSIRYGCRRANPQTGAETGMKCRTNTVHSWVLEKMAEKVFAAAWSEYREEIREGCRELCRQQTYSRESQDKIRQCKKRMAKILKDVTELESAKQEGLVVERAYKALRRSYDTKISQEKALLARLQERWQVPEMGDVFTWNDLFPDEKVSREFLDAFVPRIISIDGERFIWELQLMQNHCTVQCEREGAGTDAQIRVGKIVQEPPE